MAEAQAQANSQVQSANQTCERIQIELEQELARARAEQLHAKACALVEELRQTCAEGRAHNQQVTTPMQRKAQAMGRGRIGDSSARSSGSDMLFLPGKLIPDALIRRDQAGIAQAGFVVQFTRDLQFAETDEWSVRNGRPI